MNHFKKIFQTLLVIHLFLFAACLGFQGLNAQETRQAIPKSQILGHANWQEERDYIGLMAAFSVVYTDWQTADTHPRGYNIGCVLVNNGGEDALPVYWARNSVNFVNNKTQHGEVRTLMGYSFQENLKDLTGYTLYGTLEPCAQCSGMAAMLGIDRVVWGQDDREYGGTMVRLNGDKDRISPCVTLESTQTEYCWEQPFPKTTGFTQPIQITAFWDNFGLLLEEGYQIYKVQQKCDPERGCMVDYLYWGPVRSLFEDIYGTFIHYTVQYETENQEFYDKAKGLVTEAGQSHDRNLGVAF
ncbi:MAG: nucleoside deaminase [Desulfatibacillum sp.]|nr:nucleoside deaminase [Desulfatibacillum sp.]